MTDISSDYSFKPFLELFDTFLKTAPVGSILKLFPAWEKSPTDSLFADAVNLKRRYKGFRIQAGLEAPTSLCFSKITFIGTVKGKEGLQDVSGLASFNQSSLHKYSRSAEKGATGALYANNIHTLKENAPWWEASFPEEVTVKWMYFYRRSDWHVINDSHIRIIGLPDDGPEEVCFYPGNRGMARSRVHDRVHAGILALKHLQSLLVGEDRAKFSALMASAITPLTEILAINPPQKSFSLLPRRWKTKKMKSAQRDRLRAIEAQWAERLKEVAGQLAEALMLALGNVKDFGTTVDDGLDIQIPNRKARFIRFRTYGDLPPGLGGAELYSPKSGSPFAVLGKKDLKFRFHQPPFVSPESYRLGLRGEVRSRRVDLGECKNIERLKVWNINRQQAANTLFLEIAMKVNEDDPWIVVYDHGAPFRLVCEALGLINMLVASGVSPAYTAILGKMFTQYRRKPVMKGVARLFRKRDELFKTIFESSNKISAQTRFAAPLRLGKHGLGVPIAFRDQKVVMQHLVEMRDKIREAGHKPLFMYGTLLGAIREKDFIPHDDDIDLAVIMEGVGPEDLNAECDRFIELLNSIGVKANRGAAHSPLIHCHRGPITYDIFLIGHVGDKIYWPHSQLKLKEERADIFLPTGLIEFKGETFDAPHNPEAVSEARYGKDWHIPNPAFEW